jgi:hypothetical protein
MDVCVVCCIRTIIGNVSDIKKAGRIQRYKMDPRNKQDEKIPVGATFSAPVQTGSGAHPASSTMCNGSLSPGVKRSGRGGDHPPPSSSKAKERVELYLYSLSGPSWPILG